jgi:hypothetical protein
MWSWSKFLRTGFALISGFIGLLCLLFAFWGTFELFVKMVVCPYIRPIPQTLRYACDDVLPYCFDGAIIFVSFSVGMGLVLTAIRAMGDGLEDKEHLLTSDSPLVIIKRAPHFEAGVRRFGVFIDDKKVGTISYGHNKVFKVPGGKHSVYIKMDWSKSEVLNFDLNPGERIHLLCGCRWSWKGARATLLDLISFKRPLYIKIDPAQKSLYPVQFKNRESS